MVTAVYLQADTKEMLRALAAPEETFDSVIQRLVLEVLEARRAKEPPAPPPLVPDALAGATHPAATMS